MSEYTRGLAEYIAGTRYEDLPEDVVEHVKLMVLDAAGAGLLGAGLEWSARMRTSLFEVEGAGDATVWGTDRRLSAPSAAMANATAVHGFEIDDVGGGGHNGSVTLPSILALAEHRGGVSGKDLINAVVTGVETAGRVSDCIGDVAHVGMGFHGPGLIGTFSAAAASARTLELNADQVVDTLGTAGQQAASLMFTHSGGMGKRMLAGQAARNGVIAAVLARNGFTNADDVFEAEYGGFCSAHTGNRGREFYNLDALVSDFGTKYHTRDVAFKLWACRAPIHPSLEAIKELRAGHPFEAEDVEKVRIGVGLGIFQNVAWPFAPTLANHTATMTSAQLNHHYVTAIMLLERDVFVDQFSEEKIYSKKVANMLERIEIRRDPAFDVRSLGVDVEIVLKDGTVLKKIGHVRTPHHNPPSHADIVEKFRKMTKDRLSTAAQDEMISLCGSLESAPDATDLVKLMRVGAA